jgi:tripartite-type tricarboxylate transporter receptor subunit TctC
MARGRRVIGPWVCAGREQHIHRVATEALRTLPIAAVMLAMALAAPLASAESSYPRKPVRIVVPYPAGGTTDRVARAAAQKMSEAWGQSVIVDNRPGAGGSIGAELVAKAPPDGCTLLMGTVGTHAINPSLHAKMPYDHVRDFAPVILVADVPNVLVVHPSVPVSSVQELIAYAKANPDKLHFASSGSGTSIRLSGELFKVLTGVQIAHVPHGGSASATTHLRDGRVQLMFDDLSSALPSVTAGKLRALAVTSKTRAPALPDTPTVAESGIPDFEASSWFGLLAPVGTPRGVVTRINSDVARWLASPDAREKLAAHGASAVGGSPEDFERHIQVETAKWARVVRTSGAKSD